jgi:hypothetical protein
VPRAQPIGGAQGQGAPAIASASSSRVAAPPAQPLVDSAADPIAKTDALIAPEAIFAANGSAGLGLRARARGKSRCRFIAKPMPRSILAPTTAAC